MTAILREKLSRGADAAIPLSELAERMGVTRREAETAVQSARLNGEPIVSNHRGIYLGTDQEALDWCKRASRRALTQLDTVKAVERGVERRRTRQETLWRDAA